MKTITGRVVQIVYPDEFERYIPPTHGFLKNKIHVRVLKQGVPSSRWKQLMDRKQLRRKFSGCLYWTLAMDECPYELGDHISVNVEPYFIETSIMTLSDGSKGEKKEHIEVGLVSEKKRMPLFSRRPIVWHS